MKLLVPFALIATCFFLLNCKKSAEKITTHINCDGLNTDTTGTGDTGRIYIQNAFTPNNDGLNDVNGVITRGISSIEFTIYDGNNAVVFTTTSLGLPDPHGLAVTTAWAPSGNASTYETYYYKIQATTTTNHHIGACGELYKLACFPTSIPRTSVHFEDQLLINGTYSATTIESLPDCP